MTQGTVEFKLTVSSALDLHAQCIAANAIVSLFGILLERLPEDFGQQIIDEMQRQPFGSFSCASTSITEAELRPLVDHHVRTMIDRLAAGHRLRVDKGIRAN